MSDHSAQPARPVSLFTIVLVLVLFGAFLLVVRYFYRPTLAAPQNVAAENLSKDLEWRADPAARRKALAELRESTATMQPKIDAAMDLVVQKYSAKK